ncbi:MAG TPA: Hint domain-containing protein, partial [Paracoccaceae bacterium]|nr:Hint domain-containing protein [Paracoccaceae bacterium]
MATFTLVLQGDQIGSYLTLVATGSGASRVITLGGVQALGSASDRYTVTVTNAADDETQFRTGQSATITDPQGNIVAQNLAVQPDLQNGRMAGDEHLIFSTQNFVIDLGGVPALPGTVVYNPSSENADSGVGDNDGQLDFADFVCFTPGTLILTPAGERPVEALRPGDRVATRRGAKTVRWVGARAVRGTGRMAPIWIRAGAFGNRRDLLVSPQHRMVVSHWRAELLFGQHEVPGSWSIGALGEEQRAEVLALFPELAEAGRLETLPTALPLLRVREGRLLAHEMRKSARPQTSLSGRLDLAQLSRIPPLEEWPAHG